MHPLTAGEPRRVGPYRVVGRIGSGGMGTVYAALDDHDRPTAVKRVHRPFAGDAEFRARFAREVALVRRVRSAGVPRFLGTDTGAEVPWLATEYVAGPVLHEHVGRCGPLTGPTLTVFAADLAEALAAIHAVGVVHRDLKPGNVILSSDGPKVLDFGIARAAEETALTRTGGLVGTPGWIAPEQYAGQDATDRSDMFAWGALVAFAATGRHPFGAGGTDTTASRILHDPPELDGVPAGLRELLARALDKDPARRPGAAGAAREAVALLPAPARTPGGARGRSDAADAARRAWTGVRTPEPGIDEWSRHAPPARPWPLRGRRPAVIGAAATVLVLLAGAGAGVLASSGGPEGEPPTGGGEGVRTAGSGAAAGAEDLPEEYRDLYENGRMTVAPHAGPGVVRRLEPAPGEPGEGLDQLRVTFADARYVGSETAGFEFTVGVEYLPAFGSLRIDNKDFVHTEEAGAVGEGPELAFPSTAGVLAEVSPEDPEAEFTVTFLGGDRRGVVYYLPDGAVDDGDPVSWGQPGGVCYEAVTPEVPGLPESVTLAAHEPPDDATAHSCAFTGEAEDLG
ncbi:serine/threonine-protein kinase [Nocardiopsis tropica]|uniref:Serine/threonine-protein kinase n=1 Tax=Nocardiopsis tropica TaxID=109330 RepID=A0ABV1ZXI1_9ACTN